VVGGLVLGAVVVMALTFLGVLVLFEGDMSEAPGVPSWYGPALAVFIPPGALLGGWLRSRRADVRA